MSFCNSNCHLINFTSSIYFEKCWMLDNATLASLEIDSSDPDFIYTETESIMDGTIIALQCIFGTILNFLVIVALLRNSELRMEYLTPTIISIAVANFIHSIYTLPILSVYFFVKDMPVTNCQFFSFIGLSIWLCSAWNLFGFSSLRCLAVYFPNQCDVKKCEKFRGISIVFPVLAWIISFLFFSPVLLKEAGQFGLECKVLTCRYININIDGGPVETNLHIGLKALVITIGVVILILNIATFSKVSMKIQKVTKEEKGVDQKVARRILEKEKKMGVMLASLSILFFLVYTPSFFLQLVDPYARLTHTTASIMCNLMNWSIGVLDPLVYVICQKSYRTEIKMIVQSMFCCDKNDNEMGSSVQMHRIVQKSNNMITLETVHV